MENNVPSNTATSEGRTKSPYEFGDEVTFEFENGDAIQVNKFMIAYHSDFFWNLFFGSSPATKFKVENFDSEDFRTFLDCLFGEKKYSALVSVVIHPIAHRFQVREAYKKCVDSVLKTEIYKRDTFDQDLIRYKGNVDENLALLLNSAFLHEDDELAKKLLDFVRYKIGLIKFLENEKYRNALEPKSMCRFVRSIKLYSFMWEIIYKWGKSHLEKQSIPTDICSFFKEIEIFSMLKLDDFESVQAIFDFHEMSDKKLLDSNHILEYLKNQILCPSRSLPDKSEWEKLDDDTFSETIKFSHPFVFSCEGLKSGLLVKILTNNFFNENYGYHGSYSRLRIKMKCLFRSISLNSISCFGKGPEHDCLSGRCPFVCNSDVSSETAKFFLKDIASISSNEYSFRLSWKPNSTALPNESLISKKGHDFCLPYTPCSLLEINDSNIFQAIESIKIKYIFHDYYRFRVLKTRAGENFKERDTLFFTKKVSFHTV